MPKKYAKHGRKPRKPTPRQENFVKGIAAGKTLTQAALDAGYSPKNPDQSGYQALNTLRGRVPELLARHGIGEDVLIEKYLVPLLDSVSGTPRWSPDGRQIAFDSLNAGNLDVFVVDSQGGPPRRLTPEPSIKVVPSWSRDGRWIYFTSNRSGELQVLKMPSTGEPAMQVTRHGGFAALESPDGKFLYYAKGLTVPGLWRIPTDGGKESEIISSLEPGYWGYWAVVENGIYYLDMQAKPGIDFFDFTTHRTTRVFDLENRPASGAPGLAISPDRKSILYTQLDALNSDIVLVENFR